MTRSTSSYETSDSTAETRGSTSRRTIVAGAAWTIPVVAVAVATPAAAASLQPTLEFVNGPYTVPACGTLGDVVLHATTDGSTPATGQLVTVTLPAGLKFSDGTTTKPFPVDSTGDVVISGITAFGGASTGTITASTGSLTTTAPAAVTGGNYGMHVWNYSSQSSYDLGSLPAGVSVSQPGQAGSNTNGYPVGSSGYFLGDDGNLYDAVGRALTTSGDVISFSAGYNGGQDQMWYVKADGSIWVWNFNTYTTSQYASLPSGVSVSQPGQSGSNTNGYPVGSSGYFLGTDGNLYDVGGRPLTTSGDVTSYAVGYNGGQDQMWYVKADGSIWVWNFNTYTTSQYASLPSGVSVSQPGQSGSNTNGYPLGSSGYFLGTDGNLYDVGGRPLTTSGDVTSYAAGYNGGQDQVQYIKADGSIWVWTYSGSTSTNIASLPTGVSVSQPGQAGSNTNGYPIGSSGYFLGTDGNLYDASGRPLTTTGDVTSYAVSYNGGQDQVQYITASQC